MGKELFNKFRVLLTKSFDKNLKKRVLKTMVRSMPSYDSKTLSLTKDRRC
jgi:ribosomal protein S17E